VEKINISQLEEAFINQNINPASLDLVFGIHELFDEFGYEYHEDDVQGVLSISDVLGTDAGPAYLAVLKTHLEKLLEYVGDFTEEITIREIYNVMLAVKALEDLDPDLMPPMFEIIRDDETDDDAKFATLISLNSPLQYTRVLVLIKYIKKEFMTNLSNLYKDKIDTNIDDLDDSGLDIIKLTRVILDASKPIVPLGAKLISNGDVGIDKELTVLIGMFIDRVVIGKTVDDAVLAANDIMSLLLVSNDARYERLPMYSEYISDIIEDQDFNGLVYTELVDLDKKVHELLPPGLGETTQVS